jgi:hypothetical protein
MESPTARNRAKSKQIEQNFKLKKNKKNNLFLEENQTVFYFNM